MSAVSRKRNDIAKMLIDKGAQVNVKKADRYTALHMAAGNGNNEGVVLLLEHGADPYAKANDQKTAFLVALANGHGHTARLIKKRMSTTQRDMGTLAEYRHCTRRTASF